MQVLSLAVFLGAYVNRSENCQVVGKFLFKIRLKHAIFSLDQSFLNQFIKIVTAFIVGSLP